MCNDQPPRGGPFDAARSGRRQDRVLPAARNTTEPCPLVDGIDLAANFISQGLARGPSVDQIGNGVDCLAHGGHYGRIFQPHKPENSSMGFLIPQIDTSPMKNRAIPKIDLLGVVDRVEALREALGLGKGAFAQSFGVDPSSYSKMLQYEKPIASEHAYAMAERWGVSMDFIYRGDLSKIEADLRTKIITILNQRQA